MPRLQIMSTIYRFSRESLPFAFPGIVPFRNKIEQTSRTANNVTVHCDRPPTPPALSASIIMIILFWKIGYHIHASSSNLDAQFDRFTYLPDQKITGIVTFLIKILITLVGYRNNSKVVVQKITRPAHYTRCQTLGLECTCHVINLSKTHVMINY
mgnify:CR=1 FL=1